MTGILTVIAILVGLSTLALIQFSRNLQVRKNLVTTQIAPGVMMTREVVNAPDGQIPEYIVRADVRKGWKLRLVPAADNVIEKHSVSQIAEAWNAKNNNRAPVAVNGGFFAYEGAAVGAVKADGEWQRLPWKNRTAIGWNDGAKPFIDNLSAVASVKFSDFEVPVAALNGTPTASTCSVLTWRFAPRYTLKTGEIAVALKDDKIVSSQSSGTISLPKLVKVLIIGANAQVPRDRLQVLAAGEKAKFAIECTPAKWNDTTTILGAGPRLIRDGKIEVTHVEEEFRPDVLARGPRTTIGIDAQGNLLILVIEAWHDKIRGMTLDSVAAEIQRAGAVEAINLDGGSSTVLWVKGKALTHKSDLMDNLKIVEPASDRVQVGVTNAVLLEKAP